MSLKRKTESNVRPSFFSISVSGDNAIIRFATNITEKVIKETDEDEGQTVYNYESYILTVKNRPNLKNDIYDNYDTWLKAAKQLEYDELAAKVRATRDALLAETDSDFCIDRIDLNNLTELVKNPMAKYRQALRDIPEQKGFPYDVKFPHKPNHI